MRKLFYDYGFLMGRMVCQSKSEYISENPNNLVIFNANIITSSNGKIWYGDLDLTKDGNLLIGIAEELGEPLYILREQDARFAEENKPNDILIAKAVWNTTQEIPIKNEV